MGLISKSADNRRRPMQGGPSGFVSGDPYDVDYDGETDVEEESKGYSDTNDERGDQYLGVSEMDWADVGEMIGVDSAPIHQTRRPLLNPRDNEIPSYDGHQKASANTRLVAEEAVFDFNAVKASVDSMQQIAMKSATWRTGVARISESSAAREATAEARNASAKAKASGDPKDHQEAAEKHEKAYAAHELAHDNADNLVSENSEEAHSAAMDYHERMVNLHSERALGALKGAKWAKEPKTAAKDTVVTDSESEPMDSYDFQDLPIIVENEEGTVRTWKDKQGKSGETEMLYDYGFIDGYHGVDGDEVDVYIGPNEDSEWAFVIHQMKTPKFEDHDEDKVMLGFDSEDDAKTAYLKHYNDPGFYGGMTAMKMDEFKKILEKNATEDEPTALTHLVGEAMKKESVTAFFDAAEKLADILDADGVGKAQLSKDGGGVSALLRGNYFEPSRLHYYMIALKRIAKSPAAQAALNELIAASAKGKRNSMKRANRSSELPSDWKERLKAQYIEVYSDPEFDENEGAGPEDNISTMVVWPAIGLSLQDDLPDEVHTYLRELRNLSVDFKKANLKTANRPDNDLGAGSNNRLKSPETVSLVGNGADFTLTPGELPNGYQGDDKQVRVAMMEMGLIEKPTTARRKTAALEPEDDLAYAVGYLGGRRRAVAYDIASGYLYEIDADKDPKEFIDTTSSDETGGNSHIIHDESDIEALVPAIDQEEARKLLSSIKTARRKTATVGHETETFKQGDKVIYKPTGRTGKVTTMDAHVATVEFDDGKNPQIRNCFTDDLTKAIAKKAKRKYAAIGDGSDIETVMSGMEPTSSDDDTEPSEPVTHFKGITPQDDGTVLVDLWVEDADMAFPSKLIVKPVEGGYQVIDGWVYGDNDIAENLASDGDVLTAQEIAQRWFGFGKEGKRTVGKVKRKADLSILKQLVQQAMSGESDTEEEMQEKEAFYFSEDLFGYTLSALISEADGKMRNYDNDLPESIVRQVIRTLDDKKVKRDLSLEEESDYGLLTNEEESRHAHGKDDKKEASTESVSSLEGVVDNIIYELIDPVAEEYEGLDPQDTRATAEEYVLAYMEQFPDEPLTNDERAQAIQSVAAHLNSMNPDVFPKVAMNAKKIAARFDREMGLAHHEYYGTPAMHIMAEKIEASFEDETPTAPAYPDAEGNNLSIGDRVQYGDDPTLGTIVEFGDSEGYDYPIVKWDDGPANPGADDSYPSTDLKKVGGSGLLSEKDAQRFDREMGLAHHEYYGTPAMHIMAEKIEADELGMDIFGEENSYDFTPGERSISSIAVQNLVEERPRLLADRSTLLIAAAKAYRKVMKPIRSKVSVEQVNISKISAHQVDENLGTMMTGMLTFQVTLASHTHRRRANVSLEMPVVNGDPVEAVTMVTAGGERLPFTLEAVDKVMNVRRDSKAVSRGYHGVPLAFHFEY